MRSFQMMKNFLILKKQNTKKLRIILIVQILKNNQVVVKIKNLKIIHYYFQLALNSVLFKKYFKKSCRKIDYKYQE